MVMQEREGDMGISVLQLETAAGSIISKIGNSLVLGRATPSRPTLHL